MAILKRSTNHFANWAHKFFLWPALFACFVWLISGFTHPLMTWVGPQPVNFRAPVVKQIDYDVQTTSNLLTQTSQQSASLVKVVASENGALLQATYEQNQPRQYFDLTTGARIAEQDKQQAIWLAGYYSGLPAEQIEQVEFINEFSAEYPWVNRLLPVYRIRYNDDAGHIAFIYTETNTLASLTNDTRIMLQSIFRALHTWNWLEFTGPFRVLIIGYLMLALLAMSVSGLIYLINRSWRRMPAHNKLHRASAYLVVIPLFMWSFSGFYHLLTAEYAPARAGLKLSTDLPQTPVSEQAINLVLAQIQQSSQVNSLNLIAAPSNEQSSKTTPVLRLSYQAEGAQQNKALTKEDKYKGISQETKVVYFDGKTGQALTDFNDKEYAMWLAEQYSESATATDAQVVRFFGMGYDFRNKRLPVWRVSLNDADKTQLFIDSQSGVLADASTASSRLESLSFSMLHKWNFLVPLTGREVRDYFIVAFIFFSVVLTYFGLKLQLERMGLLKRKQR
ncbi:PepSY domain-containing protein [Catenovulum agarivorans]|uniref:PepSY domain-containing protein n=1 Tax=Catenovulum agarivorans TaxID=1172192 RepID=UPI0002FA0F41|nr:PepSY domain-containing protein [Catenovulum agarivorans]